MPKARFFTWYRVAPLAVVFVFGLISLVYSCAPAAFFKPLYPIDYEAYVKQSSISHNLDPYLVCAVIKSESNWDPEAESNQGAQGLDAADARDCPGYDCQGVLSMVASIQPTALTIPLRTSSLAVRIFRIF